MIEKIQIKNIATYDNQGVCFENLKKVNFIYGTNGCGKTTLSNFIHDNTGQKFNNCSLIWQNDLPLTTLVYNKEFRERNFGTGKLNGVELLTLHGHLVKLKSLPLYSYGKRKSCL